MVKPTVLPESPAVLEALRIIALAGGPEIHWQQGDLHCDCLFQMVGDWNNPQIGRTLRIRLCCIYADLFKQYPQFVQVLPYYDPNRHTYTSEPAEWDSPDLDMPLHLWHRQLAIKEGKSLAEIREEYAGRERERPKKVKIRKSKEPTKAEVAHAEQARMRLSGWLLPGERIPEKLRA